jgi:hypothetical protein
MKRSASRAYLDGFGTVKTVLEHDDLTVEEILTSLDPHRESDPSLTPWKRGFHAAVRSAFGQ